MSVLVINLEREETERLEADGRSGLALSFSLYHEYEQASPIVLTAPSADAVGFPGCAFFTAVFRSPVTGKIAMASSPFAPGYSMYRLGYEAIVIIGRARKLQMLSISADGAERVNAEAFRGMPSESFENAARRNITDVFLSIGRAGENGVHYAAVQSGGAEALSKGLGCLFGWKNIKGIMFPGFMRKDSIRSSKREGRVLRRQEKNSIARRIRKEGGGVFIDASLRLGWLPVEYYTERTDPRASFLDGKAAADEYGVYPVSCQECHFSCGRRTRDNRMLPTWKESAALGANLGFYSIGNVRKIADAVREEGLAAADTGALLAYLRTLPGDDYTLPAFRGKGVDEYVRVIHLIGSGRGLGERLSGGLKDFPDAIAMGNGLPFITDIRGDKAGAVLGLLGLEEELPASLLLPPRPLSDGSGAVMALYETAYRYALISRGFSPMGAVTEWWGRLPGIIFRFTPLLRIAALLFRAYGLRGLDLLSEGMGYIEELSDGRLSLPEHFMRDPRSSFGDGATVSAQRSAGCYEREKRIALMVLKSIREKRRRPSSESSAAVGPDDERGRDGDPGLQNTTPSS